jgi:putative flavoprotein involved in K+ transport
MNTAYKQHFDTVIIGGGQAGLAMGYYLKQQQRKFVILDANERVGEAWRKRWSSLRLFTPATLSSLPGLPFSTPGSYLPSKDEMAAYLENYARTFELPVHLNEKVESLARDQDNYVVTTQSGQYRAKHVIVATGPYHTPYIPSLTTQLDPNLVQLHSREYQSPAQLPEGNVLVVGAGNSGAEIATELSKTHHVYLSGRDTGNLPGGSSSSSLSNPSYLGWRVGWWLLSQLTSSTKLGERLKQSSRGKGTPRLRLKARDLLTAGIERVGRTEKVVNGQPALADGRVLEVASIIWATGFRANFGWIKLPIFDADGYPRHRRGVVDTAPGLYFLGLPFLHTLQSSLIGGSGEDARFIAEHLKTLPISSVPRVHAEMQATRQARAVDTRP